MTVSGRPASGGARGGQIVVPGGFTVTTVQQGSSLLTTLRERVRGGPDRITQFPAIDLAALIEQSSRLQASQPRVVPQEFSGPIEAIAIGEPIQEVFCRRRSGGTGGVLVRGKATEVRVELADGTLTVSWHLVLSVGRLGPIQVRDVRNGPNRQGSFSQNYNKRAGTFTPGNFVAQPNEYPQKTGIGGNYIGLTTVAVTNTYSEGSNDWDLNWNFFIREGDEVTRIIDSVVGPSDNFIDYVLFKLRQTKRYPAELIDMAQMLKAAQFLENYQLYCNAVFDGKDNFADLLNSLLPAFLLIETSIDGKFALAPLLPVDANGSIITGRITPALCLTEEVVIIETLQITPATADARKAPRLQVSWRQQTSDTHPPLMRTLAIGSLDPNDPTEPFDLSGVATSEIHAAAAGAYRAAMREHSEGILTVKLVAGGHTGKIRNGQVIQILLQKVTEYETPTVFNFWGMVTRTTLDPDGTMTLVLEHFPVDSQGRSIVALAVMAARAGITNSLLPYPQTGAADEPGRSTDTTVPASTTSGVPFSAGGSGITNGGGGTYVPGQGSSAGGGSGGKGFDEILLPPAPPVAPPASTTAPRPGGGGPVYGPTVPIKTKPLWKPPGVTGAYFTSPYNCEVGIYSILTRLQGMEPQLPSTPGAAKYDSQITSTAPVEVILKSVGMNAYWGEEIEIWTVKYINEDAVVEFDIWASIPLNYPLIVEELNWRCKLRDGSAGPIRYPGFAVGGV